MGQNHRWDVLCLRTEKLVLGRESPSTRTGTRTGSQGCWVSHPQHKQHYFEAFASGIKKERGRPTMKHHMR